MTKTKRTLRINRHIRSRKKMRGTGEVPRLTVFRSNKYIYAQIVDDHDSKTIVSASDIKVAKSQKLNKSEKAKEVGKNLASLATVKNIKKVVFDRGGYKYHGRVKALADGAREGGLLF